MELEEALEMAAPLDDTEYTVTLGKSLMDDEPQGEQEDSDVFASFGYEFQPASVDKSTPGLVSVGGSSVHVLMGSSSGAPGGVGFKGKLVEHKETDCLLIFDGSGFRLERCPFSCMQLRHVRAPTPRRRVQIQDEAGASNNIADTAADSKQAGTPATGAARTGKRPVGRPKGSGSKRAVGKPKAKRPAKHVGVKRPIGRPKGSTKAAIAAKKARLAAEAAAQSST
jgi:hypothetical protein